MTDLGLWFWGLFLSGGFLLGYLHATEAAFLAVNDVRVHHRAEGGDPRAVFLSRHLEDREDLLSFLLFLNKFALALVVLAFLDLFWNLRAQPWPGWLLYLTASALAMVCLQRFPAALGSRYADRLAIELAWPLRYLERFPASLVVAGIRASVRSTGRFLGSPLAGVEPGFKFDEIRLLLEASAHRGVLDAQSNRMLQAILGLGQVTVRQAMLPLDDLVVVSPDARIEDAARRAAETGFSRLPILKPPAEILGYVHVIDLLVGVERNPDAKVVSIQQEILTLEPGASLVSALRLFRSSRYHMACVVEAGRALGVLTVEDVLERIVGDIEDEHDQMVGEIRKLHEGVWTTDPHVSLKDLEEALGASLGPCESKTLGGYLKSHGWPASRDEFEHLGAGFCFRVEKRQESSVRRVRIERTP